MSHDPDRDRLVHDVVERVLERLRPPATAAYMTTAEAAAYLGVAQITLEVWRRKGEGPAWRRLGKRSVRYLRADVEEFARGEK